MKEILGIEAAIIIARNLKKARGEANLTQEQVATLAGINRVSYSNYETARRIMTIQNLVKIAKILNVTTDEILFGVWEAMNEEN